MRDAKSTREIASGIRLPTPMTVGSTGSAKSPDLADRPFRQLGFRVVLPTRPILGMQAAAISISRGTAIAPLSIPVGDIVELSAEKQMVRIHAGGLVTSVKDAKPLRNQPSEKKPRDPVRAHVTSVHRDVAITVAKQRTEPEPATGIRLRRYSAEEAFEERCVSRHRDSIMTQASDTWRMPMKRYIALLAVLTATRAVGSVPTVQITESVLAPDGAGVAAGAITCSLSQPGSALDGGASQRVGASTTITLGAGGVLPPSARLVPNDVISPSGTAYLCTFSVRTSAGRPVTWSETWQLASTPNPVAIGAITRVAAGGVTYVAGPIGPVGPTGATGPTGPTGPSVYDLAMSWIGRPIASEVLARIKIAHAFTVPTGCTGSQGAVGTNPAAAATVTVNKNGAAVGTANISTGGAVTWTCAAPISVAVGDLLTFVAQASADSTLADVSLTITGAP